MTPIDDLRPQLAAALGVDVPKRQRIEDQRAAVGLEVHVEAWSPNAFFTVRGFNNVGQVLLSRRYENRVRYRVPIGGVYFTHRGAAAYRALLAAAGREKHGQES